MRLSGALRMGVINVQMTPSSKFPGACVLTPNRYFEAVVRRRKQKEAEDKSREYRGWIGYSYQSKMLEKKALMKMDGERVENKLQSIRAQFTVLDSSMQKLSEKFELQSTILENQMDQNEMWASLLEDRLTSVEVNLLYNYTCKTIHYLHCQVLEKLPDLVGTLPTLSSILRKKGKNQRIRSAWESVLERLGLQEGNVKTLCAFFIAHSYACYCPVNQRQNYSTDISSVITKVVKNQLLQHSLLSAVCLVENGKAGGVFQNQKALSKKYFL